MIIGHVDRKFDIYKFVQWTFRALEFPLFVGETWKSMWGIEKTVNIQDYYRIFERTKRARYTSLAEENISNVASSAYFQCI